MNPATQALQKFLANSGLSEKGQQIVPAILPGQDGNLIVDLFCRNEVDYHFLGESPEFFCEAILQVYPQNTLLQIRSPRLRDIVFPCDLVVGSKKRRRQWFPDALSDFRVKALFRQAAFAVIAYDGSFSEFERWAHCLDAAITEHLQLVINSNSATDIVYSVRDGDYLNTYQMSFFPLAEHQLVGIAAKLTSKILVESALDAVLYTHQHLDTADG